MGIHGILIVCENITNRTECMLRFELHLGKPKNVFSAEISARKGKGVNPSPRRPCMYVTQYWILNGAFP